MADRRSIPTVRAPSERGLPIPRVEHPRVEQAHVDQQRVETPRFEQPHIDPMRLEQPHVDPVRLEQPHIDPVRLETPQVTSPRVEQQKTEALHTAELRSPLRDIAAALDVASTEANSVAKIMATEAGLKSVTRDEEGNLKVDKFPIVGDAAISFQKAMQTAAITDGERVIKADLVDMAEKFRNDPNGIDPTGFRNAAAAYRKEKVQQYEGVAGPAVGLSLGHAIDNTAIQTYRGLLNQQEGIKLHKAAESIEIQIQTAVNERFALANGGMLESPEGVANLQKIAALQGQRVANPRLGVTKERVDYEMRKMQSETEVAQLDAHMATIQKEKGVEAAYFEAEKIRTNPRLELQPAQRMQYYSRLVAGIEGRIRAETAIDNKIEQDIKFAGDRATEGDTFSDASMAALRARVTESRNPALIGALQAVETVQPIIRDWRTQSIPRLEQNLAAVEQSIRQHGETPALAMLRAGGTKLLANMREGIEKDQLAWATKSGTLYVPPIDFAAPDVAQQMRERVGIADTVAATYGRPVQYLLEHEKTAIQQAGAAGGKAMLDSAALVVSGFGDRAPAVFAEVSKESPVLAHMGGLMTTNGSPSLLRDAANAVALRQSKDFKHPRWLTNESDAIRAAQLPHVVETYGNAFFLARDTGRAAVMTAEAAFWSRSDRHDYDPKLEGTKPSQSKEVFKRTLQEAAGARITPDGTQYGGIAEYGLAPGNWLWGGSKVLIPGNIRADRFGDVIGALKPEDVVGAVAANGKPYSVRDIQRAVPVATQGGYQFAVGDPTSDDPKWIRGADGRPFTLDIERLEPVLRRRVPGAYAVP